MGRAIVRDADAFLFDEPLSNLDAKLRGQMRTEIARLQKRLGITTVYVTHDQTEAMTLGDRVAVLKRGVLQQLASPRELYENPGNLFVAGFIGSPPMNFLPATVEGTSVQLPFGSVQISEEKAKAAAGKGLLIAGIRPEHFEDASVVENPHGLDVPRYRRRGRVARQRGVRLRALRGSAGGAGAAAAARARPGRRVAAHAARRVPRRHQHDRRRETRPRSGSTPRRCTSSTRPPVRTSPSTGRRPARSRQRPARSPSADPTRTATNLAR